MAFDIELSRNAPIGEGNNTAIALFCHTDPSTLTMRALKVWQGSQGTSTRGKKAALVERYVLRLVDDVCRLVPWALVSFGRSFIRVHSYIRFGWMKEMKEDICDAALTPDEPGPLGLSYLKTQSDSPGVTSTPLQDRQLVPLAEAFSTADQVPKFTMAQILQYFSWELQWMAFQMQILSQLVSLQWTCLCAGTFST